MPTEITQIDLARLAAYLDGEGHIGIFSKDGGRLASQMRISVGNTDLRLIHWLKDKFGGYVQERPDSRRRKRYWLWVLCSVKAANLLEQCLPYFIMKRDQAEIAIAFQKLMGQRGGKKNATGIPVASEIESQRAVLMFKLRDVRESAAERVG